MSKVENTEAQSEAKAADPRAVEGGNKLCLAEIAEESKSVKDYLGSKNPLMKDLQTMTKMAETSCQDKTPLLQGQFDTVVKAHERLWKAMQSAKTVRMNKTGDPMDELEHLEADANLSKLGARASRLKK